MYSTFACAVCNSFKIRFLWGCQDTSFALLNAHKNPTLRTGEREGCQAENMNKIGPHYATVLKASPTKGPLALEMPEGKTQVTADRLYHVLLCVDHAASVDRAHRAEDLISAVDIKSLAARLL